MKGLRGGGDVSSLIRKRWVCLLMVTVVTHWLVLIGVRVTRLDGQITCEM
jgi:hypothetical protein